jgi:hypothetical protein
MEFTAANIRERMARDTCGLEGHADYDAEVCAGQGQGQGHGPDPPI